VHEGANQRGYVAIAFALTRLRTAFDIRIAIALDAFDQSAYLNRLMQTYEDVSVVCVYVLSTLLPDQHAEIGLTQAEVHS
jgi:hypothetical protein